MARRKSKKSSPLGCLVFVVIIFISLLFSTGSREDKQTTKSNPYSTAKTTVAAAVANTPTPVSSPTASPTPTAEPTATPKKEYTYIYNKSTKKFHEESCSSVDSMKPKNRGEFTGTREEMIQKGYDPCGRCKP